MMGKGLEENSKVSPLQSRRFSLGVKDPTQLVVKNGLK